MTSRVGGRTHVLRNGEFEASQTGKKKEWALGGVAGIFVPSPPKNTVRLLLLSLRCSLHAITCQVLFPKRIVTVVSLAQGAIHSPGKFGPVTVAHR